MGTRLFEEDDIARYYQQYRIDYATNTEFDKEIISFLREKQPKDANSTAVDIACGTGFLSRVLARHFSRVIGVDCSEAQIKVAKENTFDENVEYRVGFGEDLHFVSSNSVDLITVALGIHYLNTEQFYEEVERVLKPGGLVVLITFDQEPGAMPVILRPQTEDVETISGCQDLMDEISRTELMMLGESTQKIAATGIYPAPTSYEHKLFKFTAERVGDINTFVGHVNAIGGIRAYMKTNPDKGDPREVYRSRLLSLLSKISITPEKVQLSIGSQFHCSMYRKPLVAEPTD